METKLFETLSKCKMQLQGATEDLSQLDGKCMIGDKSYTVTPMNEKLQTYKTGWTKYLLCNFSKLVNTSNKNIKVSALLHLIHASQTDIVIARVIKYSVSAKDVNIRYILMQGNKEQQCNNLKELYQCMTKSYNYSGRILLVSDFKKESDNEENSDSQTH